MEKTGNRILITFDQAGGGLKTFDVRQVRGFAISGADRQFVRADAAITGRDTVEVWSDKVPGPVRCPICLGKQSPLQPPESRRLPRSDLVSG